MSWVVMKREAGEEEDEEDEEEEILPGGWGVNMLSPGLLNAKHS